MVEQVSAVIICVSFITIGVSCIRTLFATEKNFADVLLWSAPCVLLILVSLTSLIKVLFFW